MIKGTIQFRVRTILFWSDEGRFESEDDLILDLMLRGRFGSEDDSVLDQRHVLRPCDLVI